MGVLRIVLGLAVLLASTPAWCIDIVAVLERSQAVRMKALPAPSPDPARAAQVQASFSRVLNSMAPVPAVELRIVGGGLGAEAMLGHVIVASESLADLPEGERLFVLAHEMGHIALGHWDELCALYRRHIPGEVRPDTTEPVAEALGAEAHEQAWRQEFAADAYGYRAVYRLGIRMDAVYALMLHSGALQDTATHPGTRRRVAQLREIDLRMTHSTLQAAAPSETDAER
jgi:Zn-dependent protease with chaperone function